MMLMHYVEMADKFLRAIEAGDEPLERSIELIEKEIGILKANINDKKIVSHQLYDILFIVLLMAAKTGVDLDAEWEKGWQNKLEKYMKK